jgi:hypothetical protein
MLDRVRGAIICFEEAFARLESGRMVGWGQWVYLFVEER